MRPIIQIIITCRLTCQFHLDCFHFLYFSDSPCRGAVGYHIQPAKILHMGTVFNPQIRNILHADFQRFHGQISSGCSGLSAVRHIILPADILYMGTIFDSFDGRGRRIRRSASFGKKCHIIRTDISIHAAEIIIPTCGNSGSACIQHPVALYLIKPAGSLIQQDECLWRKCFCLIHHSGGSTCFRTDIQIRMPRTHHVLYTNGIFIDFCILKPLINQPCNICIFFSPVRIRRIFYVHTAGLISQISATVYSVIGIQISLGHIGFRKCFNTMIHTGIRIRTYSRRSIHRIQPE